MPPHSLRPQSSNPFLAHRLEGWQATASNVQFPVSFGVYDEGEARSLVLSPTGLPALRDALRLPSDDQALLVDVRGRHSTLPWGDVDQLGDEADIVHLPAGADPRPAMAELPQPLLADPAHAVPDGSQVAISLQDGCHGTVVARDPTLLRHILAGFLADYQVTVLGRDADLPALTQDMLAPLLRPIEPGSWWDLALAAHQHHWVLQATLHDGEAASEQLRWVSEGEGGRWRAGWAW